MTCRQLLPAILSVGILNLHGAELPKPFTPVRASAKEFRCLGRITEFGKLLLPAQIVAADGKLLVEPATVTCDPPSCLDCKSSSVKCRVVKRSEGSASWEWSGESADFVLASKLTADCDGFCWYEIQLTPKGATKLKALSLEIPRSKSTARYLHTSKFDWSNVSQGLPELGGRWSAAFTPYVWLGDEERGLAWFAESDEGCVLANPNKAASVETVETNNVVLLKINFLDHETIIDAPLTLRFGLQASPVKPVSFAWRGKARILHDIHYDSAHAGPDGKCELDALRDGGVKTVVIHDSWTKYFGQMVPADSTELRNLIRSCHERNLRLLVYVGYGIARTAPELKGKHDEWSVMPLIPWDPGYKPETRGFDATCANSGWADWLVARTDELFRDYDLDGIYFDGTSEAWRCENQSHACGWKDSNGRLHTEYPILAARRLMRRLEDVIHGHKKDAILDVHMSSNLTLPTLAFCDSLWNGEQFETHTSAEHFQVPLHVFRTEFMGYAHGMDMEFLCYENRPFAFDEAVALAWVHGIEVRPYPKSLAKVTPLWRAMDQFGVSEAKWQPYWAGSGATCDREDARVCAWTRNGKALLFVSHLERSQKEIAVQLDRQKLGLKGKKIRALNALTGADLPLKDGVLALEFNGMTYKLVELGRDDGQGRDRRN